MSLDRSSVVERIWALDHTVWKPDPTEISNRLGWLDVMTAMRARAPELDTFAAQARAEGFTTAVLLGMGGSSLAPEVLRDTFGARAGIDLVVLDTTHPGAIARVEASLDLDRTLFIVASKSGRTIETLSHLAYFSSKVPASHFVAITDPGTSLGERARAEGFREVFVNPPDIGGRYSALSMFGLVPAALLGIDVGVLLDGAAEMARACEASDGPGASLGFAIGDAALAGRDKCTIVLPSELRSLGVWIEQLIAESTGKEGKGIVPVVDEPRGEPEDTGDDRLFVAYGEVGVPGDAVVRLPACSASDLGGEFFRWEFATAVACAVLGINAFDQPNVEEAKAATAAILSGDAVAEPAMDDVPATFATVKPGEYVAIQAYIDPTPENHALLTEARAGLCETLGVATTLGFGPRFLHSTGQLHKGGANNVVCLQIVDPDAGPDTAIPGASYTFGQLIRAQALGDLQALRARGRRVARTSLLDM